MLLKELLSLIGFSKIQQICLIKILFLTGTIGFINPESIKYKNHNIIQISNKFLSSIDNPKILSSENNEDISTESAESILENAKFDSKEKAFNWLDNLMQQKFHRGNIERHQIEDKFKNSIKLNSLIQKFDLIKEIKQQGTFNYIVVTGCSEKCLKNKTLFLSRLLIENKVKSENIYFIGSERLGYPYLEPSIERILAEHVTKQNNISLKDNLDEVKKVFIKVANEHLFPFMHHNFHKMNEIRKIFKDYPQLFNIQLLIDKLKAEPLFAGCNWPTETDIILRSSSKTLRKYHIKIIEIHNKKVGPHITRGTTKDSALAWLNDIKSSSLNHDNNSKILLISNQPKAKYQFNVFKSILSDKYNLFMAASSSHGKQNLSLLLSELASIIHEAKELVF